jgi:ketosteroid isomerase-like protein
MDPMHSRKFNSPIGRPPFRDRSCLTGFVGTFKGPVKFDISDLSVTVDRTTAFSHSIQHVSGTDTKGKPVDLTVRVTDVYRKIKDNWLIGHEHVSVPVDLDTGTPDLSSKP